MDIDVLHNKIRLLLNQGQSIYYSPEEIDSFINMAQTDYYEIVYNQYEATQKITDAIRPFKKIADHTITSDKVFLLPSDYYNVSLISSLVADSLSTPESPLPDIEYSAKIYTDGEFVLAGESELLPPTKEDAKCRILNGAIDVLPKTVSKIRIYFIKKPSDVVFAYDLVNDKITYKSQGSVHPEWSDSEISKIIHRTVKYLGVSMESEVDIKAEDIMKT